MRGAQFLRCPNCGGWALWIGTGRYWRCKSCKGYWCEVAITRHLVPPPAPGTITVALSADDPRGGPDIFNVWRVALETERLEPG